MPIIITIFVKDKRISMQTSYYIHPQVKSVWRGTTKVAREKLERLSKEVYPIGESYVPVSPSYAKLLIASGWRLVKVQDL